MWKILLIVGASQCQHFGLTPQFLDHVENLKHVAGFGDAQHRGPKWYQDSSESDDPESDLNSDITDSTESSSSSDEYLSSGISSAVSSLETAERRLVTKVYRTCTPCPHDMLKKFKNKGIKWICGGYQRARRSFKSECMMRYRNCQDGTLFVKIYDHRCKNDTFHGRHWFYVYRA
ncbi:hypothetical protein O3G_MSEX011715 [Manduca sexta]|uniref:Uncharacterized protein n=1 Tax=Manduca sexta TaxID=7130 RepID=A0A921ZLR3_MANSE|nr:hypothetical protein O3G_MSEX011715 [Manduca sexta]